MQKVYLRREFHPVAKIFFHGSGNGKYPVSRLKVKIVS